MRDEIGGHDALVEHEDVAALWLNGHVQPVIVELPERLDAREVLDAPAALRANHRLVDTEIVRVAVNQHDRAAERDRLGLKRREEVVEPGPLRRRQLRRKNSDGWVRSLQPTPVTDGTCGCRFFRPG